MEERLTDAGPAPPTPDALPTATGGTEPPDDAHARDHAPRWVAGLDAAVLLLTLPALAWLGTYDRSSSLAVAVGIGILFLVAEWFPVDVEIREQGHTVAFTAVPLIVGLCTLDPLLVVGLRVAASVLVLGVVHRQHWLKFATNVVSHTVQVAVAAAVLVPLLPGTPDGPWSWLVAAAAVGAAELAGTAMVTAAISIFEGGFDRELLDGTLTGWAALVPDIALGLVAAILLDASPAAVVLLVIVGLCLLGVVRGYAHVTARYRVLEVLDSFTDELGRAVLDDRLRVTLLAQLRERLHADEAWIQLSGDRERRAVLRGAGADPVEAAMPDPSPAHPPTGRGAGRGAKRGDRAELTDGEIVGSVHVGGEELLVGVGDRLGEVREFDGEDVRLFDLLLAHASVALQNVRLLDQLREEVAINERMATHDQLTGLPNRNLLVRRIERALAPAGAGAGAVVLLGLDRFKEVNDTLGHRTGDDLLVEAGRRLRAALDPAVPVARIGGDEFAVLLPPGDEAQLRAGAATALAAIDGGYRLAGMVLDVSATAGLAVADGDETPAVTLLRQADVAMYLAKEARQPLEVYAPDRDTSNPGRLAMAGRLRNAIEAEELTLQYQPQVHLGTAEVVGVEALVRWTPHGQDHPVSPVEFIEVAERTGLIHPLTRLVLRTAVQQSAAWVAAGMPLRVSANLSARNLEDPSLADHLAGLLAEHRLAPERFEVEVTETSMMHDPKAAVATLRAIHRLGVSISIDDFGTGHSSLAYLTQLPVDQLKIDRSFVMELDRPGSGRAVVHAIIDLARHLGLEVVAEGVETRDQLTILSGMGCAVGQGYHWSRPLPVDEVAGWVDRHRTAHGLSRVGATVVPLPVVGSAP